MTKVIKTAKEEAKNAPSFTLEQLLKAKTFAERKDALVASLDPDKRYTVEEATLAVKKFMERKV